MRYYHNQETIITGAIMNRNQRAKKILEHLSNQGFCKVEELEHILNTSVPTIYRDLNDLAARNLIVKVHGGIELPHGNLTLDESVNSRHLLRLAKNRLGKEQIAAKAISLVKDDDVIFADSSTTVYYFIRKLLDNHAMYSNLTIVTNSGAIIRELSDPPPSITLIALGGVYNTKLNSFLGRIAFNAVKQLHISKAFISAAAVSTTEAYTFHESHAEFLEQVTGHADRSWLLVDHLKFETKAVFPIRRTADFTGVISDNELSEKIVAKYLAAGINLIL
jgi:DeoR/GlpR family transcriptional regulator of sugar metabolism